MSGSTAAVLVFVGTLIALLRWAPGRLAGPTGAGQAQLATLALSWFPTTFARLRRHMRWVERASGALLVSVGLLLPSGQFTALASWATRFTPDFILQNF